MFKRRGFGLVLISILLAVAAAFVARNWIQARTNTGAASASAGVGVVVAALEIPFGTKVEARHVRTIVLPRDAQVGNHFEKPEDVVGLIATQKMIPGEILLKERFTDRAGGSTLAAVLRPNMRAVTVRVDDVVGVAGFLLPGNHVDVVAARMIAQRAETETVLRNLNVLAVDQTASQDKDQPVVVRAVTLEVTPKQAEVLVRAREEGRIQLTLRNPTETSDKDLLAEETKPAPAPRVTRRAARSEPARPPSQAITIIRGTNVKTNESTT